MLCVHQRDELNALMGVVYPHLPVPCEMDELLGIGPISIPRGKNPSFSLTRLDQICIQMATRFYGSSQVRPPAVVVGVIVLPVYWSSFYDQEGMRRAAQSSTQQQKQQHLSLEE